MPTLFWVDFFSLIISLLITTSLALMVGGLSPGNAVNRTFFYFTAIEVFWISSAILLRLSLWLRPILPVESIICDTGLWFGLTAIFGICMCVLLLFFTATFLDRRSRWTDLAVLSGILSLFILYFLNFREPIFANVRLDANGMVMDDISNLGLVGTIIFAQYMVWSLFLFWKDRRRTGAPYLAFGIFILMFGIIVGGVLNAPFPIMSISNALSASILGYGVISLQIFNPLRKRSKALQLEIVERKKAQDALEDAHEKMEGRVQQRTSELIEANRRLALEIRERTQTEESLKGAYAKLKKIQAQLVQSAKLASIGELAAGVAHELNQPLMVIRSASQFMDRTAKDGGLDRDRLIELLKPIERNTKRMMSTIGHLQVFSRQSRKTLSPVEVNRVIKDSFLMVGEQLRVHGIEVTKDLGSIPRILGDANQLEQVFLNLITNARDAVEQREGDERENGDGASRDRKKIGIVTRVSEADTQGIEIFIKDTGGGIRREHMGKIFDPFFTTKEIGKGTGLGLSISYGIIKDHKGEIEVMETGPDGTTFRVAFPVSESRGLGDI